MKPTRRTPVADGFCGDPARSAAQADFPLTGRALDPDQKLRLAVEFHAEAVRIYRLTRWIAVLALGAIVLTGLA